MAPPQNKAEIFFLLLLKVPFVIALFNAHRDHPLCYLFFYASMVWNVKISTLRGVWYIYLKTCVLLFENMCENTCG